MAGDVGCRLDILYPLAYAWLLGWLSVAILWEYAVQVRKGKAKAGVKWFSNPHAIQEYCDLIEK